MSISIPKGHLQTCWPGPQLPIHCVWGEERSSAW